MNRLLLGLSPVALLGAGLAACEMPHGAPIETTQVAADSGAATGTIARAPAPQSLSLDAGAADASAADGHGGVSDAGAVDGATALADGGDGAPSSGLPAAATLWASAALPPFDAATVAHVREILSRGSTRGKLQTSIAKIGDSITATPEFLFDAGNFGCTFGDYDALSGLASAGALTLYPDNSNTFTRQSQAAVGGWTTADALGSGMIAPELSYTQAATAVVMLGTNDVGVTDPSAYAAQLGQVVDAIEANDVVAVLSTIPPRTDYAEAGPAVDALNAPIRALAAARHLPLVDFNVGLRALPGQGIGADGVHPSVEVTGGAPYACDLRASGLAYGYDLRNLLTLQVLDRVWRLY